MKNDSECIYAMTMIVKYLVKQRQVLLFRHAILVNQWNDASDLIFLHIR